MKMLENGRTPDLSNMNFGRLTVVSFAGRIGGRAAWLCSCTCGNSKIVRAEQLLNGATASCGCLRKEGPHTTHGLSHTRICRIWKNMNTRCYNSNSPNYVRYGGRGISICDEWLGADGFIRFYNWAIESGYSDGLSIDRKEVNEGYSPSNCRWADAETQSTNKTNNVKLEYCGQLLTVSEIAKRLNISPYTIYSRLKKLGWNAQDALNIPISYANALKGCEKNACFDS